MVGIGDNDHSYGPVIPGVDGFVDQLGVVGHRLSVENTGAVVFLRLVGEYKDDFPPDIDARRKIVEINLKGAVVDHDVIEFIAERTEGYSGRDLAHLVQESAMSMLREENPDLAKLTVENLGTYELRTRKLARDDFDRALGRSSPTLTEVMLERYREWQETFGSE